MKKIEPKTLVVAALAVFAAVFFTTSFIRPMLGRKAQGGKRGGNAAAQAAAKAAKAKPAPGAAAAEAAKPVPADAIDAPFIRSHLARWIDSPSRDPFAALAVLTPKDKGPRAAEVLTLRAIWRQTGGRLAVINNSIVREGDELIGFEVEAIESRSVRVRGSNGVEQIEFRGVRPRGASGTNAPSRTSPRPAGGGGAPRARTLSP